MATKSTAEVTRQLADVQDALAEVRAIQQAMMERMNQMEQSSPSTSRRQQPARTSTLLTSYHRSVGNLGIDQISSGSRAGHYSSSIASGSGAIGSGIGQPRAKMNVGGKMRNLTTKTTAVPRRGRGNSSSVGGSGGGIAALSSSDSSSAESGAEPSSADSEIEIISSNIPGSGIVATDNSILDENHNLRVFNAQAQIQIRELQQQLEIQRHHCPICIETMPVSGGKFVLLRPCGHCLCVDCNTDLINHSGHPYGAKCPICKLDLKAAALTIWM